MCASGRHDDNVHWRALEGGYGRLVAVAGLARSGWLNRADVGDPIHGGREVGVESRYAERCRPPRQVSQDQLASIPIDEVDR